MCLFVSWTVFAQEQNSWNSTVSSSGENFADVVNQNFSQWDINADGVLSKDEIETAATNPKIKSEAAAAVATIVHFTRNTQFTLPPLTEKYLTKKTAIESRSSEAAGEPVESDDSDSAKTPLFQKVFHNYLRKINQTSRELFPQGSPMFDAVHQGQLGDCPFVSTVGALVYRNPSAIKAMFAENGKDSTIVNFGNGQKLNIHNLTDVDIALWSSAGTNGLWLTVLEKAYRRELVSTEHPDPKLRPSIYDKFGPSTLTIEILDGFKTEKVPLKKIKAGNEGLSSLRLKIIAALTERQIVKTGTSKNVKTRGITPDHAYAVLGFSKDTDSVQVWNPHGQEFHPTGDEGLENGYTTKRGLFSVPLKEFVQIFDDVNIETSSRYVH